jgi:hypothetical protein
LHELTELREVRAHQREMVAIVEVADPANPIGAGAAVQLEPQRVAGIGRICDQRVIAQHGDDARARGQDDHLDAQFCAELLAGMEPMEDVIRASGKYGARVPVPDDADAQTRMLAFNGRDPMWAPARRRSPANEPLKS